MRRAKENRAVARAALKGNWTTAVLGCIVAMGIMSLGSTIPVLGSIVVLLLSGAISLGLTSLFMAIIRNEEKKSVNMVFDYCRDFSKPFLATLLMGLYILLWILIPIVGIFIAIVKSYSYSMTYYLMRDDASLTANEAITKSREIMNGHKWRFFCLQFSFIGWSLLSVLTLGIGFIWLIPYTEAASAAFYEEIKPETIPTANANSYEEAESEVKEETKALPENVVEVVDAEVIEKE